MARKEKKNSKPKFSGLLVLCTVLVVGIAALLIYLYSNTRISHDRILDNVFAAGVNVGGMTKSEALAAIQSKAEQDYTSKDMVFTIGNNEHRISPQVSEATLDAEAAVNAAYGYGRSGFLFRRYKEQKAAAAGTVHVDLVFCLNLNTDAIRSVVQELAPQYNQPVVQTTYRLEGTMPQNPDDETGSRVLVIALGQPGYVLDADRLYAQLLEAYNQNNFSFEADCQITPPEELDWDSIYQENCILPINASMNPTTYRIVDETNGYGFKPLDVKNAINNSQPGQELQIPFQVIQPDVTRETLEADLYKDILSEYTAEFGSSYNRDINLKLSTAAVNGTVLLPGETFDYNSTLGERTPEAGYRLGNTYAGMETIQTYGGGICQTSSTLYYCALMADLEIVSRTNHGFISDYVPFGMDATVSWGGPEFRFKNNTKYPIKIEAYSNGGNVTVKLWGTDDRDYYVKMEYDVLAVYNWKTVEEQMYADNAKGYRDGQVITSPYTGYKIQTYRCKYNKATNALISKEPEAYSVYSARNRVVCKIVEKEPVVDPSTPTEPTTPPDTPEEDTTQTPTTTDPSMGAD